MSDTYKYKRITEILFNHWNQVRGERLFPSKDKIDELELQNSGIWDDVFIIDIFQLVNSNGYRFSYTGKNLGKEFTKDIAGKFIKNIVVGFLETSNEKYNIVAEQKRPLQQEEDYKCPENGVTIKYRQILLPLGPSDDDAVTSIIGGMRHVHELRG